MTEKMTSIIDINRLSLANGTKPMVISVKTFNEKFEMVCTSEAKIDFLSFMESNVIPNWLTEDELLVLSKMVDVETRKRK